MNEESQPQKKHTLKVHNVLRLSPSGSRDPHLRPIDIKIDEIRRKLHAMVRVKVHRSGSESKSAQK